VLAAHPEVTLHRIVLRTSRHVRFNDFSQTKALIDEGRQAGEKYLLSAHPMSVPPADGATNRLDER